MRSQPHFAWDLPSSDHLRRTLLCANLPTGLLQLRTCSCESSNGTSCKSTVMLLTMLPLLWLQDGPSAVLSSLGDFAPVSMELPPSSGFLSVALNAPHNPLPPSLYTWDMGLGKILVNAVPLPGLASVSASPSTVSSSSCALLESLTGSGLATSIVMCCHWVLVQFLSAHLILPPP